MEGYKYSRNNEFREDIEDLLRRREIFTNIGDYRTVELIDVELEQYQEIKAGIPKVIS